MQIVASLPQGLEDEGAKEVMALGAQSIKCSRRFIEFQADMACLYRIYLRARLPFRLLREIARFSCDEPESLYEGIQRSFDWEKWINPSKTFRVDVTGKTYGLPHTHFTALQVKNALIDFQRSIWGQRSSISINNPDFCLHLHLRNNQAILSLDGSAESLHKRGFRPAVGIAPLKENLAAGLMRMCNWQDDLPLVDPLCGSGTFLIEAVSMSLGLAPGLSRDFLIKWWNDFDLQLWNRERNMARSLHAIDKKLPKIIGFEKNTGIANQAKNNILNAGLDKFIEINNNSFQDMNLPLEKGILVCNPPYGKRIGVEEELFSLYEDLGSFCKSNASGWDLWILSGNAELSRSLSMKATKKFQVSNGGLDCRWLHYKVK